MSGLHIKVTAVSETGLCKRENQDRILARVGEGGLGDFGIFVVADGMGSQLGGGQAAETAIRFCEDWWQCIMPGFITNNEETTLQKALSSLVESVHQLNEAVINLGNQMKSVPGTTFSVLFIYGKRYGYVHLGDSRIYKTGSRLEQISSDDTWIAQQVRSGVMSEYEAKNHPQKHILTQCVGSGERICVHRGTGAITPGMGFILCSDGFYHHLSPLEINSLTQLKTDISDRLNQAVITIYARGATDNLSAVVIAV